MATINSLLMNVDWLKDFSENLVVQERDTLYDQLFPNIKTDNLVLAYEQATGRPLPKMAFVHGFDTEAHIASRGPIEAPKIIEKLLVKEKINLTEKYLAQLDAISDASVPEIVASDAKMMSDNILTRKDVMVAEIISTGKATIKENNLNYEIDYGVPAENKPVLFGVSAWNGKNANPLNNLDKWIEPVKAAYGDELRAITSSKVARALMDNTEIAKLIFNTDTPLRKPRFSELKNFLREELNLSLVTNDSLYEVEQPNGTKKKYRFFPEDEFIIIGGARDEAIGQTIWGITPEEKVNFLANGKKTQNMFITIWQYLETNDPVAVFTKATALFVPALKIPNGLVQARVLNPIN